MQVRCFSTTSTLLKSITPHKATGVFYTDLERLALTLPADLFQFSSSIYAKRGRTTTYYTIYIPSKDMPKIRALVLPYLHSSMHFQITNSNSPWLKVLG